MTNYNEDDLITALTAIANGTLTKCKERDSGGTRLFRTLFKEGFITGSEQPHLNGFVLVDMALTPLGRRRLQSITTSP
ncbi:hypothetical protein D3C77_155210 [compost metagenome]